MNSDRVKKLVMISISRQQGCQHRRTRCYQRSASPPNMQVVGRRGKRVIDRRSRTLSSPNAAIGSHSSINRRSVISPNSSRRRAAVYRSGSVRR